MKKKQTTTKKTKAAKLYLAVVQRKDGTIAQVLNSYNYDLLIVEAMDVSKEISGFWTVFNTTGKQIDGNFQPHKELTA